MCRQIKQGKRPNPVFVNYHRLRVVKKYEGTCKMMMMALSLAVMNFVATVRITDHLWQLWESSAQDCSSPHHFHARNWTLKDEHVVELRWLPISFSWPFTTQAKAYHESLAPRNTRLMWYPPLLCKTNQELLILACNAWGYTASQSGGVFHRVPGYFVQSRHQILCLNIYTGEQEKKYEYRMLEKLHIMFP